jgi:hypothetical protein
MQLPGFLKQHPTEDPPFPGARVGERGGYAARGCLIGTILAILCWFVPVPVAAVVRVLGLTGPFGDYMLMAIPYFIALPLIGAGIGAGWRRH